MPYTIIPNTSDLNWLKLSGQLTVLDLLALQGMRSTAPRRQDAATMI